MADRPATTSKTKKKPGRKRRVAGWLLLVIGVLITGVWGVKVWQWSGYCVSHWSKNPLDDDVTIFLWPFALASLLGGGWLVWSGRRVGGRRRAMAGLCRKCGYDLAGLAAGAPCPECGGGGGGGAVVPTR